MSQTRDGIVDVEYLPQDETEVRLYDGHVREHRKGAVLAVVFKGERRRIRTSRERGRQAERELGRH